MFVSIQGKKTLSVQIQTNPNHPHTLTNDLFVGFVFVFLVPIHFSRKCFHTHFFSSWFNPLFHGYWFSVLSSFDPPILHTYCVHITDTISSRSVVHGLFILIFFNDLCVFFSFCITSSFFFALDGGGGYLMKVHRGT